MRVCRFDAQVVDTHDIDSSKQSYSNKWGQLSLSVVSSYRNCADNALCEICGKAQYLTRCDSGVILDFAEQKSSEAL